jgi:BON domain-containing protein
MRAYRLEHFSIKVGNDLHRAKNHLVMALRGTAKLPRFMSPLGLVTSAVFLFAISILLFEGTWGRAPVSAWNSARAIAATADQQKMSPSDRELTQKIRKAIHRDSSLSAEARNIKIFTLDGKVTLRGPVRSEKEKMNLDAKAINASGQENVTDQLTVMAAN